MDTDIPNLPARQPSPEELRLKESFDELRKNQITFLNEAGKRVIELSTGLLGVLFAVMAFGKDFPPLYLQDPAAKILACATLSFFFLALLAGFLCVQPQEYALIPGSIKDMRATLARHHAWKAFWFRAGSILFVLGAFWLAALLILLIRPW